jgi:ankyrin repeat protein
MGEKAKDGVGEEAKELSKVICNALPGVYPGRTALHTAAAYGNVEIVKIICKVEGIDLNLKDVFGYTPLHLACYSTHENRDEVIKTLLSCKEIDANVSARERGYNLTALHLAVKARSKDVVDALLNTNIDVDARSSGGWTPLHLAVKEKQANEEAKYIIRTLIKYINRNCPETINTPNEDRKTPLHTSVESRDYELVDLLLDRGEKLNPQLKDMDGRTPLDIAIKNRDYWMVQKLQKYLECVGLYGDEKAYADAANAILVVAALIATVTFNAWSQITVPESTPFWVFSSLSFYFAVATLLSGAGAAMPSRGSTLANVRSAVYAASVCLAISLSSFIGAFTTAALVFAPLDTHDQRKVIATTAVGGCACLYFLVGFLQKVAKAYSPLFLYADYRRKAFVYKYVTRPLANTLPKTKLQKQLKVWYKETVVDLKKKPIGEGIDY